MKKSFSYKLVLFCLLTFVLTVVLTACGADKKRKVSTTKTNRTTATTNGTTINGTTITPAGGTLTWEISGLTASFTGDRFSNSFQVTGTIRTNNANLAFTTYNVADGGAQETTAVGSSLSAVVQTECVNANCSQLVVLASLYDSSQGGEVTQVGIVASSSNGSYEIQSQIINDPGSFQTYEAFRSGL